MRFYLVLAMCSECVPLRMFTDKDEAMKFAEQAHDIPPKLDESWPFDYGEHFHNLVVEFENGEPVECTRGRLVNVREVVHFQAATGREES